MGAEEQERGEMSASIDRHLSEILKGQREYRDDIKRLAESVYRHDERITDLRKDVSDVRVDVDALSVAVSAGSLRKLIAESAQVYDSLDVLLKNKVVDTRKPEISGQDVGRWTAIIAVVLAFLVDFLIPWLQAL